MKHMSKEKEFNAADAPPDSVAPNTQIDRMPVTIHAQYIKDLSFENPNAPMPLTKSDGEPTMNVEFAMDAKKIEMEGYENSFEVSLHVEVEAKKGELTSFMIDLQYGMMLSIGKGVPEDRIHPLLLIEMPSYLFPYVRQIISEMTQQAGYLPLLLSPVNFKALYRQRFGGPQVTDHTGQDQKQA